MSCHNTRGHVFKNLLANESPCSKQTNCKCYDGRKTTKPDLKSHIDITSKTPKGDACCRLERQVTHATRCFRAAATGSLAKGSSTASTQVKTMQIDTNSICTYSFHHGGSRAHVT